MPEHLSGLLIRVSGTPPWLLRPVKVSISSELYSDCFWLPTFCSGIQFFDSLPFPQHLCDLQDAMSRHWSPSDSHPTLQHLCDLRDAMPRQRSPSASHSVPT